MFCKEYVIDYNATSAARRAGYGINAAAQMGFENLQKLECITFIGELLQGKHARVAMTAADLIAEYEKILRVDRRNLVDADGRYKGLHEIDEETASAIDGYKVTDKGVEIKLVSKRAALRDLGETMALFKQVSEVVDSRTAVLNDKERQTIADKLDNEF